MKLLAFSRLIEAATTKHEVETTASVHVACVPHQSGILLRDFAAAYPSVNHSWIFHVLVKAELPEFICQFLRMIYCNGTTHIEFAGRSRGQFLMAQGRETTLSCERLLICNGVRSIFRLLEDTIIPRNPAAPELPPASSRALMLTTLQWLLPLSVC